MRYSTLNNKKRLAMLSQSGEGKNKVSAYISMHKKGDLKGTTEYLVSVGEGNKKFIVATMNATDEEVHITASQKFEQKVGKDTKVKAFNKMKKVIKKHYVVSTSDNVDADFLLILNLYSYEKDGEAVMTTLDSQGWEWFDEAERFKGVEGINEETSEAFRIYTLAEFLPCYLATKQ